MNQQELLLHILKENTNTDFGKSYRFENIKNVQAYEQCVPASSYDDYAPLIELMTRLGEYDIFTPKDFSCYLTLVGSMGTKKIIPCTKEYQSLCYEGMAEILNGKNKSVVLFESLPKLQTTRDNKHANTVYGVILDGWKEWKKNSFSGRFLHMGEMIIPEELLFAQETGLYDYERALFAVAEENVSQIIAPTTWNVVDLITIIRKNWDRIIADIENGSISDTDLNKDMLDILMKKWRRNPARAEKLKKLSSDVKLSEIWPGLKRIVADGASGLGIYTRQLQREAEGVEIDYGFGLNAEALYARHIVGTEEYQLLTDLNFYEFMPVGDDSSRELITTDKLEQGQLYELYVTTRYGFYRYRLGEVIRVTEISEGDVIRFTREYRTSETMHCFGTEFTQQQMSEAVLDLEDEFRIKINDYVYMVDDSKFILMLETDDAIHDRMDEIKKHLDQYLMGKNPKYSAARESGSCEAADIIRLQPQTQMLFRDLCRYKNKIPNDLFRPARYLNTPLEERFFKGLKQD